MLFIKVGRKPEARPLMEHGGSFKIPMMGQTGLQVQGFRKTPTEIRVALSLLCGLVALLTPIAKAEQTKTIFNPFTGKLDYITTLSTTTITNQFSGCSGTQYL